VVERLLYTQDVGGSNPSPPTPLLRGGAWAGEQPQLRAKVTPFAKREAVGGLGAGRRRDVKQLPANGGLVVRLLP
jgi:hypothetical protein